MKSTRHNGMTNAKAGGSLEMNQHPPQMQSNLIDLTHDTLPEIKWRPIKKMPEQIPEPKTINDKQNLHHWELALQKEHYSFTYDRRYFDNLVFKKFIGNGKIIKMLVDPNDLAGATNFWKQEDELTKVARGFIKELRTRKVYDFHEISPEEYNLKAGDAAGKGGKAAKKSKGSGGGKAAKVDRAGGGEGDDDKKKKKKGDEEGDDVTKILEQKQAGLAVNKQSALQTALEHIQIEMGRGMPNFARGPEVEIASVKDVEDLKHQLAQQNIHLDYKVL